VRVGCAVLGGLSITTGIWALVERGSANGPGGWFQIAFGIVWLLLAVLGDKVSAAYDRQRQQIDEGPQIGGRGESLQTGQPQSQV
jgi:hypothetical protein